jgi:hypothetical protein
MRIVITTQTLAGRPEHETRLPWTAPSLRLVPLADSEGSHFSLSSADGTSSS